MAQLFYFSNITIYIWQPVKRKFPVFQRSVRHSTKTPSPVSESTVDDDDIDEEEENFFLTTAVINVSPTPVAAADSPKLVMRLNKNGQPDIATEAASSSSAVTMGEARSPSASPGHTLTPNR
jgi:hypothetical protein